jgi:hypothetical protein
VIRLLSSDAFLGVTARQMAETVEARGAAIEQPAEEIAETVAEKVAPPCFGGDVRRTKPWNEHDARNG